MMCQNCGERVATSRGLCSACYQRERKAGRLAAHGKRQRTVCSVDGCSELASSNGLCKRHAEQARRGTLNKKNLIKDLPGEKWKEIPKHKGWFISSCGRIKSKRNYGHERLISSRWVGGRMLAGDKENGNITIHKAVVSAFIQDNVGDIVFINGDKADCRLSNLKVMTQEAKIEAAIAMAEKSTNKFAPCFVEFWKGNNGALDCFFEEMRRLLIVVVHKKLSTYSYSYMVDTDDVIHATLVNTFFAIKSATLKSLDGITSYVCTIADTYIAGNWRYANKLTPLDIDGCEANVIDMAGIYTPSAEMEAIGRECCFQ